MDLRKITKIAMDKPEEFIANYLENYLLGDYFDDYVFDTPIQDMFPFLTTLQVFKGKDGFNSGIFRMKNLAKIEREEKKLIEICDLLHPTLKQRYINDIELLKAHCIQNEEKICSLERKNHSLENENYFLLEKCDMLNKMQQESLEKETKKVDFLPLESTDSYKIDSTTKLENIPIKNFFEGLEILLNPILHIVRRYVYRI